MAIRQQEAKMAPLKKARLLETERNKLAATKQLGGLRASQLMQATVEAESAAKVFVATAVVHAVA